MPDAPKHYIARERRGEVGWQRSLVRRGKLVLVEGRGWQCVEKINVALRPSIDPAAETYRADALSAEVGLPLVIDTGDGRWAYADQIEAVEVVDDE